MGNASGLPSLNQLRVFEAAARLLSFTQAARELHLTQSAVSQQVKSLENHLGRQLFARRHQGLDLTEIGIAYLPIVQHAIDSLAVGTESVFGRYDETRLTVQVNLSFAIYWLAPRLPEFLRAHPEITVDLVTVIHDPERTAAAADVEIRFGEEFGQATLLRETAAFPVCCHTMTDPDWRTDMLFDCTAMSTGWRTWLVGQGMQLPADQRVHLASTYAVGLSVIKDHRALAMTLDLFAEDAISNGQLIQPFPYVAPVAESYWLVEKPVRHRTESAKTFAEWILTETNA